MGHFPQNVRSPLAPKLLVGLKKSRGRVQKLYGHPLSSCKVWWRSAAARRREKQKLSGFVLFVYHALHLEQRFSHSILSPFVSRFWCGFQPSLEKEMLFQTFKKHSNYAARWCHVCLRIRSKFEFFWKFERQSLCARLRPLFRRRIEKIPQQPISTVVVDVHLYKIFKIKDRKLEF